jgi:hypothetical protein
VTVRRPPADGRARRNTELGLVIMAAMITGGLYALASLATTRRCRSTSPFLGVVLLMLIRIWPPARNADVALPIAVAQRHRLRVHHTIRGGRRSPTSPPAGTWTFAGIAAYGNALRPPNS